jgi:hypothetical protein
MIRSEGAMASKEKYLRRYTDLTALFYLLSECKLTLLNPQRWDDKNDSYCINRYRSENGFTTVLALCFLKASERYHYWKVFGGGSSSGVRIKFRKSALLKAVNKVPGFRHGKVEYLRLEQIKGTPDLHKLPLLKRWGFQDEKEYRLIYESKNDLEKNLDKKDIPIPLDCIVSVKLNPWLDRDLFEQIKVTLKSINRHPLRVVQSSLINNERWREFADRAIHLSPKAGSLVRKHPS